MSEVAWPMEEELDDCEITPPGTDGVATLEDGSTLTVAKGGRVTNEFLEFIMDRALPRGDTVPPGVVRYVGPRLYTGDVIT